MVVALTTHELGDGLVLYQGRLPDALNWADREFDIAWNLHPRKRHRVKIIRWTEVPRWQQAYGASYRYTGNINVALPVPLILGPLLAWGKQALDDQFNGVLVNWYEGPNDYIGAHSDSDEGLIPGTPIATISFGEERIFRLSKGRLAEKRTLDFPAMDGTVIVMPHETNQVWKHGVPKRTRYLGRRISITLRAHKDGVLPSEDFFEKADREQP